MIATIAVAAAIGVAEVAKETGGRILVIGTPAEENGGGKIIQCDHGVFRDVDFAMMIHPGKQNLIQRGGLSSKSLKIEYFGKTAHGTRPEEGINALGALLQTFHLIDSQRAYLPHKANINGIILEGGKANNVIPDYTACDFSIRADCVRDLNVVDAMMEKVVKTVDGLFGTTSKITRSRMDTERYPNKAMDALYKAHLESFGEAVDYPPQNMKYGSSDVGNVTLEVPTIQPYLKIADCAVHTQAFATAAQSDYAHEQMLKGAKSLAMVACDILVSEKTRESIQDEFRTVVPHYTREELQYHSAP